MKEEVRFAIKTILAEDNTLSSTEILNQLKERFNIKVNKETLYEFDDNDLDRESRKIYYYGFL